jgi:hypothetical protein
MSDGFAGSGTRQLGSLEREVESRLQQLELVGVVNGKHGSAEIHKDKRAGKYHVHVGARHVGEASDFKSARDKAQSVVGERRMASAFAEDFTSSRSDELAPGQDATKNDNGYQGPHNDSRTVADPRFGLGTARDRRQQGDLDEIDREQQRREGGIKPRSEQFPVDLNERVEQMLYRVPK